MDPPVEHSFLRFSRGCVSLSPLSLSLCRSPAPATAGDNARQFLRRLLPPRSGRWIWPDCSTTISRFLPPSSSSRSFLYTPPPPRRLFLFPATSRAAFLSPLPTPPHPLSLSPFLVVERKGASLPSFLQPTLAHNETENLLLAPGECGRMITYIEQGRQAPSLCLSLSQLPKRTIPLRGCPRRRKEKGRDDRSTKSSVDRFLDRVRCFGDMQTRKREANPFLEKNFSQGNTYVSFLSILLTIISKKIRFEFDDRYTNMSNNFPFRTNPLQRSNIGRQIRRGICDNTDNECNFFFFFPTTIDRRDPRQDADGRRGTLTVHGHERQEDCRVLRRSRRRRMNEGFRGLVRKSDHVAFRLD